MPVVPDNLFGVNTFSKESQETSEAASRAKFLVDARKSLIYEPVPRCSS